MLGEARLRRLTLCGLLISTFQGSASCNFEGLATEYAGPGIIASISSEYVR